MREEVKQVLREILGSDTAEDYLIAVRLMSACSLLFAHPELCNDKQRDILKAAYIQLETKGFI